MVWNIECDLSGGDRRNQHYVISFVKGFKVMDVHLYDKSPELTDALVFVEVLIFPSSRILET